MKPSLEKQSNELSAYKPSLSGFKLLGTVVPSLTGSLHPDAPQKRGEITTTRWVSLDAGEGEGPSQGRWALGSRAGESSVLIMPEPQISKGVEQSGGAQVTCSQTFPEQ